MWKRSETIVIITALFQQNIYDRNDSLFVKHSSRMFLKWLNAFPRENEMTQEDLYAWNNEFVSKRQLSDSACLLSLPCFSVLHSFYHLQPMVLSLSCTSCTRVRGENNFISSHYFSPNQSLIYILISTWELKILWIIKCIQVLQSRETAFNRRSVKKLFWKFVETFIGKQDFVAESYFT